MPHCDALFRKEAHSMRSSKTFKSLSHEECLHVALRAYVEEGYIGQTVRHYYYKLLSAGAIKLLPQHDTSAKNAYAFVSDLLTEARRNGRFSWNAVIDPGRRAFTYWSYNSLREYILIESHSGFMLDVWRGQSRKLEIWVEKDAMADFVQRDVKEFRIPVYVNKGFGSATVIERAARRYGSGKGWTLLYAGDFDPSGLSIEQVLHTTLKDHGSRPQIVRVTLTREDTYNLPPESALDLKEKDSRTPGFRATYGYQQKGYELDALPAGKLRQKLLAAINTYLDMDAMQQAIELERTIKDRAAKRLEEAMEDFGQDILQHGVETSELALKDQLRYLVEPELYPDVMRTIENGDTWEYCDE